MSSEGLNSIFTTYQRLLDCLKIARRVVDDENLPMLDGTGFVGESKSQADAWLKDAREIADNIAVVALWAWFERYLIEYAQARTGTIKSSSAAAFGNDLEEKVKRQIEYWRLDDVLDLYKTIIDGNRIGIAKQIKDYRDWIAHRNPARTPPAQAEPNSAYAILLEIVTTVEQAT